MQTHLFGFVFFLYFILKNLIFPNFKFVNPVLYALQRLYETMGRNPGYQPSQAKNDELIIQFQNKWKKYSTRNSRCFRTN